MSGDRLGKYMEAQKLPRRMGRKTDQWRILSASGDRLGDVYWYPRWRQYIFEPLCGLDAIAVFSADCMQELVGFLERVNAEHKQGVAA